MASTRLVLLALFIAFSFSSIVKVHANRKLLAPSLPDLGNIPGLNFPVPPITEWPEYRLPPPIFRVPNIPSFPTNPFFSPPVTAATKP
ncbi:hypothetical protein L6164_032628 [Bauhinia variegata]|uniref:Uncharacterized protein n=1 Tax=Bauhinia variegata TaxID=167791 RepID=A0ACB9KP91_BAUVA|nr:hypothetical protein L6164_032628 [Bauhinia variegata]